MNHRNKKHFVLFSLLLIAFLQVATTFAAAQVGASITGMVEDISGAVVPGATVTISNVETGASRVVITDKDGNYRVLSLPVGRYDVKAEMTGFSSVVQSGIDLVVGQQAVMNLRLQVGAVDQKIVVSAEVPLVNTTTSSVSGLVGEQQIKDLPLNGRSFDNLITLNPGAINYSSNKSGGSQGFGNYFSVAGRRPSENLFVLNGVEFTGVSETSMQPGGVSGQLLGIDAIREFNVVSSSYSAEHGKRAGSQVSIVTQSGTNQWHGSVFEYLRNSALDARNYFDQGEVPPFKRNQFGGTLGGPIRKDKTFVFGNYEGFRQRLGLSTVAFVPDLNARQGLLPNASGVPTPVSGLNPAMLPFMAFWPEPNGSTLGQGIALAYSNPKQSIREDFGTVRFDHALSTRGSLSVIYTEDDGQSITPMADPLFATILNSRSQATSLQETHVFSSALINTFAVGVSHAKFDYSSPPLSSSFPSSLSFVSGKPPGNVVIGGGVATFAGAATITVAGGGVSPAGYIGRTLITFSDKLQIVKGAHQIGTGVWIQRIRSNQFGVSRSWGQGVFTNLQSFLQGTVATFGVAPNGIPMAWRSLEGAWYLQDTIRVSQRLTLELGLRHEFTNGWNEDTGRAQIFQFDQNGVLLTDPLLMKHVYSPNNAKLLFGPRASLAWDPFGTGKTSIRAGFGIHYDLVDTSITTGLDNSPPFNGSANFTNIPLFSMIPVAAGLSLPRSCGPGVPSPCSIYTPKGIQASLRTPTVNAWNLTVEQQLTQNSVLRVGYLGSRSTHLPVNTNPNIIHPQLCSNSAGCVSGGLSSAKGTVPQGAEYIPVGTRPNPYLASGTFFFSSGTASYNALQVEVNRRLTHGLQLRGNYTWAKNLDIQSGVGVTQSGNEGVSVLNPDDPRRDWGPSAMNISHSASGSFIYELPFGRGKAWLGGATGVTEKLIGGWQMNGIVTLQTGFPFTPQVGSNRSGNGDGANPDRPNVNPAFTGPVILGKQTKWFDPNAFLFPTAGTFGNLGRGTLTGPGLATVDISLFKNTRISERINTQFRAEAFNVTNHANFGTPNPVVFASNGAFSPTAGVITKTATTSRQIQFALKITF